MKKIILVLTLVGASAFLSACCNTNPCGNVSRFSCCGATSYTGNWY